MASLQQDLNGDKLPQHQTDEQQRLRRAADLLKSAVDLLEDIPSLDDRVSAYRHALENITLRLLYDADTREPKVGSE